MAFGGCSFTEGTPNGECRIKDALLEMVLNSYSSLSSCVFSNNMRDVERFLSTDGSDCGMANINIGPNGAEIGGAFGGE